MSEKKMSADSVSLTRPTNSLKRVKTEQSPNRLPSLRGPRDLTLGGIKKKTFTPNIPVRKERIKQEVKEEKPRIKKEKRPHSRDGRNRDRGRGRGRGKIIESHSIFEARPDCRQDSKGRGSGPSKSDTLAQLQKPTIKKEKFDAVQEKTASEAAMQRLERGDHAMLIDLQNDEKLSPVILPLYESEVPIHQEANNAAEAFRSVEKRLVLLQIPDSLPGIAPSNDSSSSQTKEDPPVGSEDQKSQPGSDRCSIDALSEGKIGKLQIFKSGKCRLLLKGVHLDMYLGTPTSFTQEVVSVRLPPEGSPEGSKGHLSVLGEVSHKVVCTPNMSTLVKSS